MAAGKSMNDQVLDEDYMNSLSQLVPDPEDLIFENITELQTSMDENLQQASPAVVEQVQQAANGLFQEMNQLGEAEKECGPSGAWPEFTENKAEIKQNLHELGQAIEKEVQARDGSIKQDLAELRQEFQAMGESLQKTRELLAKAVEHGCQNVVDSFAKGKEFIQTQKEQIRQRSPQERLEAQIHAFAEEMERYMSTAPKEMCPKLQEVMESGFKFMEELKEIRCYENSPYAAQTELQKSVLRETVSKTKEIALEVRQAFVDFPQAVRQAVKENALDLLHKACHKVISTLDKAMQYLDKEKQKIMKFAPDTRLDRQASGESIYLAHAQNIAVYEPSISGRALEVKIAVSLSNASYNYRKVKECMAHSPNLKKLSLTERNGEINKIMKDASKSKENSYSR